MNNYTFLVKLKQGDPHYLTGVSGLRWRSAWPGGFQTASFRVPALLVRHPAAVLSELCRVIISKGPVTVFDGEIRSVAQTIGPNGKEYAVTLYGYGVLLTDDTFGPRVYAINDLSRFKLFNEPNNPAGSTEQTKNFEARQDDVSLRISAKPSAVFRGVSYEDGDFESFWYQLPKVAGSYVAESITQVTCTYQANFPTGSWSLIMWEYDGSTIYTQQIANSTQGATANIRTPTSSDAKLIGFALRSTENQAIYPGFLDDGAGSSLVHSLEYAGRWTVDINDHRAKNWHNQGGMYSDDTTTSVSTDKSGNNFYPDGVTRSGAACRVRFTGSRIRWYAKKYSAFGDAEVRLFDDSGALVSGYPQTINLNQSASVTGTISVTKGSTTVTGSGTAFDTEFAVGDVLQILSGTDNPDVIRVVTAIASATSLTVDEPAVSTLSGVTASRIGYRRLVLDDSLDFGNYTLTIRCLGTGGGTTTYPAINVDYFDVGVNGIEQFKDGDIYVDIRNIQVRTSPRLSGLVTATAGSTTVSGTGTAFLTELVIGDHITIPTINGTSVVHETRRVTAIASNTSLTVDSAFTYGNSSTRGLYAVTADQIAQDIITKFSASAIGLATDTSFINENAASPPIKTLTDLAPLAFDEPISGADVLDAICLPGTADDEPLDWGVFEDKVLRLGAWPNDPAAGYYLIDADDAEIEHEETIQDSFATIVAPLYKDAAGEQAIGADVTSNRVTDEYAGRKRRIVLPTDARDSTAAAAAASAYLANHDRPSQRTRLTLRRPVRDRSGMVIPLDEVRPGRLARIVGLDETQPDSSSDIRSSLTAMVVAVEYDADEGVLTLDLGDGPDSYERYLARIRKLEERARRAGR